MTVQAVDEHVGSIGLLFSWPEVWGRLAPHHGGATVRLVRVRLNQRRAALQARYGCDVKRCETLRKSKEGTQVGGVSAGSRVTQGVARGRTERTAALRTAFHEGVTLVTRSAGEGDKAACPTGRRGDRPGDVAGRGPALIAG